MSRQSVSSFLVCTVVVLSATPALAGALPPMLLTAAPIPGPIVDPHTDFAKIGPIKPERSAPTGTADTEDRPQSGLSASSSTEELHRLTVLNRRLGAPPPSP